MLDVGPNTENDVPKVPDILPGNFLKNRNQFNLIAHTSNEEVLKIVKLIKLPLKLLRAVAELIVFTLSAIPS